MGIGKSLINDGNGCLVYRVDDVQVSKYIYDVKIKYREFLLNIDYYHMLAILRILYNVKLLLMINIWTILKVHVEIKLGAFMRCNLSFHDENMSKNVF